MDSLEHRVTLADVCAAGCADAALELGSLVGDYIAVEVRENEDFEVAAALFVDELRRGDVNVPLVGHDVGIFLADLLAEVEELAVCGLDDICLCDYRNAALVVAARVVICESCDSVAALGGGHDEVEREVVGNIDAHRADGVCALGVLAEESPVNALLGNLDGAEVRKQIESLSHRNVCALDVRPRIARLRGSGRTLEDNVAALELLEHVVGDSLVRLDAVFDGQSVDDLEFNLACLYFIVEQIFENSCGFLGDDRTDAVAAADADDDLVERLEVDEIALSLYFVRTVALSADESLKFSTAFLTCASVMFIFLSYLCDSLV